MRSVSSLLAGLSEEPHCPLVPDCTLQTPQLLRYVA